MALNYDHPLTGSMGWNAESIADLDRRVSAIEQALAASKPEGETETPEAETDAPEGETETPEAGESS